MLPRLWLLLRLLLVPAMAPVQADLKQEMDAISAQCWISISRRLIRDSAAAR